MFLIKTCLDYQGQVFCEGNPEDRALQRPFGPLAKAAFIDFYFIHLVYFLKPSFYNYYCGMGSMGSSSPTKTLFRGCTIGEGFIPT